MIARNSRRLQRLVGDLLFIARYRAGKFEIERGRSISQVGARMHRRRVADCTSAPGWSSSARRNLRSTMNGDRMRIAQLLDNLVSNALKFTPRDGRVELKATEEARSDRDRGHRHRHRDRERTRRSISSRSSSERPRRRRRRSRALVSASRSVRRSSRRTAARSPSRAKRAMARRSVSRCRRCVERSRRRRFATSQRRTFDRRKASRSVCRLGRR